MTEPSPTNVAILISVSDYQHQKPLPGCKNDLAVMRQIIERSGKFHQTVFIESDATGSSVKNRLASFISSLSGVPIGELFFYYTGHGMTEGDDFYFLFADYTNAKLNQTTLSHTDLDSQLRSLKPKLAVKVIDACHSAVSYIKNDEIVSKSFEATKQRFEQLYFMFSSRSEESSWADHHISYFTRSFGEAVEKHPQQSILYKHVVDYISDAFRASSPKQTPMFVNQANFTHVFCDISPDLRITIGQLLNPPPLTSAGNSGKIEAESLVVPIRPTHNVAAPPDWTEDQKADYIEALVKKDSERYCNQEEAVAAVKQFWSMFNKGLLVPATQKLFNFSMSHHVTFTYIPNMQAVAKWLDEFNDFLIDVKYSKEAYQETVWVPKEDDDDEPVGLFTVHSRVMRAVTSALHPSSETHEKKVVTRHKDIPIGYTLTLEDLQCGATLNLENKYENIPWFSCHIAIAFTKSDLQVFYSTVRMKERTWNERIPDSTTRWKTFTVGLKDQEEQEDAIADLMREFENVALAAVHEIVGARVQLPEQTITVDVEELEA
ncbi:caspase family protein [Anatilimnocola floriformis]|uniref:caspase family protein n=1 Tax=Anatilimnocola floriformis TaxID=2948575 RepID=UPI0020C5A8ED|nr:caspase family protein [Anatilimnocola floriformis]